jgi:drug/metabolite transporter (DMT)-like permease
MRAVKPAAPGSPMRIAAAFLAVYLIWGSTYLAIRFAIETLPPLLMAGARYLIAGAIVFAWGLYRDGERPSPRNWRDTFLLGGLFFLGGNGAVVWAEQRVASGVASLLVATMPLWVVLLDWLRPRGNKPRPIVVAGVALGFLGLLVLVPPTGANSAIDPLGAFVLVVGALSWATGSLYARDADLPKSLLLASGMEMLGGGAQLALAGALMGELGAMHLATVSLRSLLALCYLTVVGSIVAFNAFTYLLERVPASRLSTYAYVNPVVAVILGWLLASEPLTARTLAGAAVIVAAVAMVIAGQAPERAGEELPAPVAELAEEPPPT